MKSKVRSAKFEMPNLQSLAAGTHCPSHEPETSIRNST